METDKAYYQFPELVKKLSEKYNKGVVILIDEYDKPIISNLGKDLGDEQKRRLQIAKENQEFLKILYDNLKPFEPYLQLVFITVYLNSVKFLYFLHLIILLSWICIPGFLQCWAIQKKN
ncbi:MAG: hypothetical protein FH762_01940 [Firmicutes bacterium]|nr:hypothetical protein [Bacillota bacterium]